MSANNKSGKLGEIYASKYLAEKGYIILETNFRTPVAEVDIIARDTDGCICFIEVKTRKNKAYGCGSDFIFKSKIEKMILGARIYLSKYSCDAAVRFDIIEVYGQIGSSGFIVNEINHIKNAFSV